jgi:hypothetical protein
MTRSLIAVAALLCLGSVSVSATFDPYTVTSSNGNFTVDSVKMTSYAWHWHSGATATIRFKGQALKKLSAGTFQYQIFEEGVIRKVDQGSSPFFQCNNKGCDVTKPVSLTLEDPQNVPSDYEATFSFKMPNKQKTGQMKIVFWGQDQDHFPYDFSTTIQFNYTQGVLSLAEAVTGGSKTQCKSDSDCPSSYCMKDGSKKPPYTCKDCGLNCCNSDEDCPSSYCMMDKTKTAPFTCHAAHETLDALFFGKVVDVADVEERVTSDPYTWTKDEGNMTVKDLKMTATAPHWNQRVVAKVELVGNVLKKLSAGTIQYQIYEEGVIRKVASGSFAYFHCDNKGCDPTQPMALALTNPNQVPTTYKANFQFQMPYKQKTGQMKLVFWGQDQDHFPYDFSVTIQFNYTASAMTLGEAVTGGSKTQCKSDSDCPSSYCMKDDSKKPPYTCKDCGLNCCNSDEDCPSSYCMMDKTKTAPFTCHAAHETLDALFFGKVFGIADADPTEAECEKFTASDTCDKGGCSWCKSAAVASACHTKANAKKLPPGAFQCS